MWVSRVSSHRDQYMNIFPLQFICSRILRHRRDRVLTFTDRSDIFQIRERKREKNGRKKAEFSQHFQSTLVARVESDHSKCDSIGQNANEMIHSPHSRSLDTVWRSFYSWKSSIITDDQLINLNCDLSSFSFLSLFIIPLTWLWNWQTSFWTCRWTADAATTFIIANCFRVNARWRWHDWWRRSLRWQYLRLIWSYRRCLQWIILQIQIWDANSITDRAQLDVSGLRDRPNNWRDRNCFNFFSLIRRM